MPIITMMRSSVVLGVMGILETVFAEPDGDHGLDHPVQGKEVFFEGGFVEEVAVDDPVLFGGEVEGDGVEEAGEAVGEDHDHEEMLPESFDVVFELDEVHCGSVFEFGGVVALDELEQAEEAHHLQVLQDFDGFDASDHRPAALLFNKQVNRETRDEIDQEPALEIPTHYFPPRGDQPPRVIVERSIKIEDDVQGKNDRSQVLGQVEENAPVLNKGKFKGQDKSDVNQNERDDPVPKLVDPVVGKEHAPVSLLDVQVFCDDFALENTGFDYPATYTFWPESFAG